ncbi:outer membrane protein [Helicobacter cetorum]|uniref:outer membrane protein n=1 Tax=Helicobacter cetorum TaxID=138563 RepID=UPI0013159F73|nr:outer membrane protein [Helicobacter cetorum]
MSKKQLFKSKNMLKNLAFKTTLALSIPLCTMLAEDDGFYMGIGYQIGGTQQQINNKGRTLRNNIIQDFRNIGSGMAGNNGILAFTSNTLFSTLSSMVESGYSSYWVPVGNIGTISQAAQKRFDNDKNLYNTQGLQLLLNGLLSRAGSINFKLAHSYKPAVSILKNLQTQFGQAVVGGVNILNTLNSINVGVTPESLESLLGEMREFVGALGSEIPNSLQESLGSIYYSSISTFANSSLGKNFFETAFKGTGYTSTDFINAINSVISNSQESIKQDEKDVANFCSKQANCKLTTEKNPLVTNIINQQTIEALSKLGKMMQYLNFSNNNALLEDLKKGAQSNPLAVQNFVNSLSGLGQITQQSLDSSILNPLMIALHDLYLYLGVGGINGNTTTQTDSKGYYTAVSSGSGASSQNILEHALDSTGYYNPSTYDLNSTIPSFNIQSLVAGVDVLLNNSEIKKVLEGINVPIPGKDGGASSTETLLQRVQNVVNTIDTLYSGALSTFESKLKNATFSPYEKIVGTNIVNGGLWGQGNQGMYITQGQQLKNSLDSNEQTIQGLQDLFGTSQVTLNGNNAVSMLSGSKIDLKGGNNQSISLQGLIADLRDVLNPTSIRSDIQKQQGTIDNLKGTIDNLKGTIDNPSTQEKLKQQAQQQLEQAQQQLEQAQQQLQYDNTELPKAIKIGLRKNTELQSLFGNNGSGLTSILQNLYDTISNNNTNLGSGVEVVENSGGSGKNVLVTSMSQLAEVIIQNFGYQVKSGNVIQGSNGNTFSWTTINQECQETNGCNLSSGIQAQQLKLALNSVSAIISSLPASGVGDLSEMKNLISQIQQVGANITDKNTLDSLESASNGLLNGIQGQSDVVRDLLNVIFSKTSSVQSFAQNLKELLGGNLPKDEQAIKEYLSQYSQQLDQLGSLVKRYDEPYLPQFISGKSSQHGVSNGLGVQIGYKQFFGRTRNVGLRYYGFFDYGYTQLGNFNNIVRANIFTYGVGTDVLWNVFRRTFLDKALNMGFYGGIQLAGNTWDSSLYHQIKTTFDNPKHLNPTNFQFFFNLGLRANFARATHYRFLQFKNHAQIIQHGVEFGMKIPVINQAYLRSAGADVTYRRLYIFYVNYNIGF